MSTHEVTGERPVSPADSDERGRPRTGALGGVLALLAVGMAAAVLLGPLVLDVMTYRTSPTTLMVTAWTDPESLTEYASAPTPFWMVKLMDLGIIVPIALAVGWGLLHGADWALRVMYPLLTGYTCLALSVTGMAVVMLVNDDPDASWSLATGFGVFALGFLILTFASTGPCWNGISRKVGSPVGNHVRGRS